MQFVCQLGGRHRVGQILLVGEHEQHCIAQFVLLQHAVQLLFRLHDTLAIVRVDHKDEPLRVLEVVAPERANLVLATDVPHGEADVLVLDRLNVEPDRRNGGDNFAQLQLVQNRRLTGSIESN